MVCRLSSAIDHRPRTADEEGTQERMQPQETGATEWLANLSIGYIVLAAFALTIVRLAFVPNRNPFAQSIAELAESLLIAGVFIFLIVRPFFFQAFYIPSESMEP